MNLSDNDELSKFCKENCGYEAKQVADLAEIPRRTLYDWWKSRRKVVELIVKGIQLEKTLRITE